MRRPATSLLIARFRVRSVPVNTFRKGMFVYFKNLYIKGKIEGCSQIAGSPILPDKFSALCTIFIWQAPKDDGACGGPEFFCVC